MWLAALSAIANFVPGLINAAAGAFNRYQERAQAAQQVELARLEAEKALAVEAIRAESELGQRQVESTGPWLKYISYFTIHVPVYLAVAAPDYAKALFVNLGIVPTDFMQLIVILNCAVWGLPVGRQVVGSVIDRIGQAVAARAERKAAVEVVKTDNKVIFEAIKAISGGKLSQEQVDTVNRVLDKTRQ